jgi:glycosyltransferase involved in cell wall biosynthesis
MLPYPKIKVLHVIHGFGTGGAETWLLSMLKEIKDRELNSVEMHFLATGGEKLTYDDEIIRLGGKIHYIRFHLRGIFMFRREFINLMTKEKFNVIHHHQDFISGIHYLLIFGQLPDIRISYLHNPRTFIDNYITGFGRGITFHLGRLLTVIFATHISGTSEKVMNEYGYDRWPFSLKRIPALYCGINISEFSFSVTARNRIRALLSISDKSRVYLFAGRLGIDNPARSVNQKNPEFAFELAKSIVTADDNSYFLFAGFKGEQGINMEKETVEMGLGGRIFFLGVRKDIGDVMSASDIFIFPSRTEGLGLVLVEAQTNGLLSFVSSSVPSEAVVIDDSVRFLDLNSGIESWLRELLSCIPNDSADRKKHADMVSRSRFSISNSVSSLLKIYGFEESKECA